MEYLKQTKWKFYIVWGIIFAAGILFRVAFLTKYPMGTNGDEAYAGYEAFALLHTGVDSHGYHNPVYFISWGSGMNVLYSWLSIPFIRMGGLSLLTIRLPQALMGCVSLVVFYFLLKEIKDAGFALFGMFLLAINPWHIMMCRWGLESNLAPALILLGVYFLVKAYKGKMSHYIPAFLCFGLVLYAYAVMWVFVPLFLLLAAIYGFYQKKVQINRYLLIGILILGILAVPLLLFLAVNRGYLPEIQTAFFSIPRMDSMRAGEISLHGIPGKIKDLLYFLVTQVDRDSFNTSNVGIYYFCSIPFIAIGIAESVGSFVGNWKRKCFQAADLLSLWFVAAFFVGCVISYVNVNKINCIHFPMIYFAANGCMLVIRKLRSWLLYPIVAIYLVFLCFFCGWYYNEQKIDFYYGYEDALEYAKEVTDGEIGVVMIRYSNLFLYTQMLPQEYLPEVNGCKNYDEIRQFGRYLMNPSAEEMQPDTVYVVPKMVQDMYLQDGFSVIFDNYCYVVLKCGEEKIP